jgi:hypothetical protein
MDFDQVISILNRLLADKNPAAFSSSWILKHAPHCYRFIHKHIRTELGHIDWDTVTYALKKKFQRRWSPGRKPKILGSYEDFSEVNEVLKYYQEKLYIFIAPTDQQDRRIRDMISISLVRLAQHGNIAAKKEVLKLLGYTIEDWIERYYFLSRWQGYNEKIQKHLEVCIHRYRYTGSFIQYVFRTLQYAGRGLRPLHAYSLDDPIAFGSERCKVENVFKDSETNEIRIYKRTDHSISGF